MINNAPFEVLITIRNEALALAEQGLTYATQSAGVKNIAYVVNGVNYYCDAQDVKEVSTCDNLMVVPQTKNWMRGLINSKGVLYSVTDLSLFAGYGRATQAQRGHLLLLNDTGFSRLSSLERCSKQYAAYSLLQSMQLCSRNIITKQAVRQIRAVTKE